MKKRALSLLLAAVLCFCLLPAATLAANVGSLPAQWTAPTNVTVTDETNYDTSGPFNLRVSYSLGADHSSFVDAIENSNWSALGVSEELTYTTVLQIDWRIDGGSWHYAPIWDRMDEDRVGANDWLFYSSYGPYGTDRTGDTVFLYLADEISWSSNGWAAEFASQGVNDIAPNADGNMILDLTRHTIDARIRLATRVTGAPVDTAYGGEYYQDHYILSPWSSIASIGKDAGDAPKKPDSIPRPIVSGFKVSEAKNDGTVKDGYPIFNFTLAVPEDVAKIAADAVALWTALGVEAQVNVNGTGWQDIRIGSADWASVTSGVHTGYMPGLTDGDFTTVLGGKCQFRARYHWFDGNLYSPWSDTLTFSSDPWKTSEWFKEEMARADELGLIPDELRSADLTQKITRREFAAVAVKAYENLSGTLAIPAVINPFTDCADIEVLKALNVGITDGVTATLFQPDTLLNREQAATMLTRVFKRVSMPGWTLGTDGDFALSYTKPALFADDASISGWAKDSVYFMAANKIIEGVGDNKFAPRAITTAEQAANYASATREQAIVIALRMAENLK